MKRCLIFGGGEMKDWRYIRRLIREDDFIIAADGGYSHCTEMGIVPHLAMGDFDSYQGDVSKQCEILRFKKEKDDTDTMLAIKEAIARGYDELALLGMTGGRMDHSLGNIQALVYAVKQGVSAYLLEKDLWISAVAGERTIEVPRKDHAVLSVFSMTDRCTGVTLENLKYCLDNGTITNDFPIGISNEFLPDQNARISVKEGTLLLICTRP